jgi:hypothetical protein
MIMVMGMVMAMSVFMSMLMVNVIMRMRDLNEFSSRLLDGDFIVFTTSASVAHK